MYTCYIYIYSEQQRAARIHAHTYTHMCKCARVYTYSQIYIHIYTHAYLYLYAFMYTYMYLCIGTQTHRHGHRHRHRHSLRNRHRHRQTHTHIRPLAFSRLFASLLSISDTSLLDTSIVSSLRHTYTYTYRQTDRQTDSQTDRHPYCAARGEWYGVASVSRIDKIIGLFCKRALEKRLYAAKEICNLTDPTDRSHPIVGHQVHHSQMPVSRHHTNTDTDTDTDTDTQTHRRTDAQTHRRTDAQILTALGVQKAAGKSIYQYSQTPVRRQSSLLIL